jgi:hypothetical protein
MRTGWSADLVAAGQHVVVVFPDPDQAGVCVSTPGGCWDITPEAALELAKALYDFAEEGASKEIK